MKIGELAQHAGVGIDTVRYYERMGLLCEPRREASGYRRYDVTDVAPLRFIRHAKALGFTLGEIRELLAFSDRRNSDVGELKATAIAKVQEIEARIVELQKVRDGLRVLVDACPGDGELDRCPIMGALVGDEP